MPLGLAIAGPVADALGVQIWFLIGGIATTVMGTGAFFTPAIMQLEDRTAKDAITGEEEATAVADESPSVSTTARQ
jgi:DHA3 family macrolide efflux protein-like MFS transporter